MRQTALNKPTKEQLTAAFIRAWGGDKSMAGFCVKKTDVAVLLGSGAVFTIDKRGIKTRFCFGYSTCGQGVGQDEAESMRTHAAASADYFRRKNTAGSAEELERAKAAPYMYTYAHYRGDDACAVVSVLMLDHPAEYYREYYPGRLPACELRQVNDVDRVSIVAAYEEHHRRHCKKVDAHLKRYGLSKIKAWTYWGDE